MTLPFLEHLEAMVGLLTGLISIVVSENREAEEREGDRGTAGKWSSHNTYNMYI